MRQRQIENSNFKLKKKLRLENLPDKPEINVLDCFSADGKIWNAIKKETNKKINVVRLDINKEQKGFYTKIHNVKFLKKIDLNKYDVIDLDSYGVPTEQLEIVLKKFRGTIFITFIFRGFLFPDKIAAASGYSFKMLRKCRSLFTKNPMEKISCYFFKNGVKKIKGYFLNGYLKNYFVILPEYFF